jgi:hypothetical protein
MQLLGKHIPAATNTRTTIEELLDAVFSVWSVLNQIHCTVILMQF